MSQLQQCLLMGGYAPYVWSAYGLAGIVLVINVLTVRFVRHRTQKKLQQWFKRQQ